MNLRRSCRLWLALAVFGLVVSGTANRVFAGRGKQYIPPEEVKRNTEKVLSSVDWKSDMEALRKEAGHRRKLIFFLQIVGELGGGL